MAEILLLRHGQASFGAANYDNLSELGHTQCRWLGEHLRALGRQCDAVVMGTMARHRQTAEQVLEGLASDLVPQRHEGLNEYNFQGLLNALKTDFAEEFVDTGNHRRDYFHNMKRALTYWAQGRIASDGDDSWQTFCARIQRALDVVCASGAKRTLVVTSGGPVAVILSQVLGLGVEQFCALTLQIKNSSLSTLLYNRVDLTVDCINDVGHLLTPDRQHSITFS